MELNKPHPPDSSEILNKSFRSIKLENNLKGFSNNNELIEMTELLNRENELRNEILSYQEKLKYKNEENSILSDENNKLRDRIEILESLFLSPVHFDNVGELFIPGYGLIKSKPVEEKPCKIAVVEEIIKLREENKELLQQYKKRSESPIIINNEKKNITKEPIVFLLLFRMYQILHILM